jgi:Spx/MgsR family transcriptional regulator
MGTLYGISNCDTVRRARKWLDGHGVDYRFHDLRRDGIGTEHIRHWLEKAGSERLLNRRAATWRKLEAKQRAMAEDERVADLLAAEPTLIRRPVLEWQGRIEVGFDPQRYERLLG